MTEKEKHNFDKILNDILTPEDTHSQIENTGNKKSSTDSTHIHSSPNGSDLHLKKRNTTSFYEYQIPPWLEQLVKIIALLVTIGMLFLFGYYTSKR